SFGAAGAASTAPATPGPRDASARRGGVPDSYGGRNRALAACPVLVRSLFAARDQPPSGLAFLAAADRARGDGTPDERPEHAAGIGRFDEFRTRGFPVQRVLSISLRIAHALGAVARALRAGGNAGRKPDTARAEVRPCHGPAGRRRHVPRAGYQSRRSVV